MAKTDTAFTGSIPHLYDHNLTSLLFTPYARDMARRLAGMARGRVLETATGTGAVTSELLATLPETVEIVATDLNQPMLDVAMSKPGMGRARFQQADALALPFPDQSFDALLCQFGVMFFLDRVGGMREARRVLKPGGRFIFNVWGAIADNPVADTIVAALKQRYSAHPSWFLERTPYGYNDPARIRADLAAAGFEAASIEHVALTGRAPDAQAPAIGLCQGTPMSAEITSLDPDGLPAATEAAAAAVAERYGPGPIEAPMQALVIQTHRT